jgi:dihydropteroate synthase
MMTINCGGILMEFERPKVAGILNLSPDSFYDGGIYANSDSIRKRLEVMIDGGADFIDVGACSSRPGADNVSEEEELNRLIPGLEIIRKYFPDCILSLDTFRARIAEIAVKDFDVQIINDISGGEADEKMMQTIAGLSVPYIIMHMRGTPKNMQTFTKYKDIFKEMISYFVNKISFAKSLGINDIIIDPGFGFSKTLDQNYLLLKELKRFQIIEHPILVGISRKSMMYKLLNTSAEDVLSATSALHMTALQNGANILRVHDVIEAVQVIKLFEKLTAS